MTIDEEQLDFQYHVDFYKGLGSLTGDPKRDAFYLRKAEFLHCLQITDAIRDVHIEAGILSQKISNEEADFHLRFGVARRTKFIWLSLRKLFELIEPERTEPLLMDDVEQAAQALNTIYINVRGTMDNWAWCVVHLLGSENSRKLPPIRIGLFSSDLLKDVKLSAVAKLMGNFVRWNDELKTRRDPSAHRIPLSVPPAVLDQAAQKEYSAISTEYDAAIKTAVNAANAGIVTTTNFEKVDALFDRLQRVGKFAPVFVHHPAEGAMKIYPTVPQDVGQLVKISRGLIKIVSQGIGA